MKKIKVGLQGRNGRVGKILTATMGEAPYSTHFEFVPDFKKTAVDVIIDFSSPAGTLEAARWCAEKKIPLVSGTTGLSAGETRSLEKFSQQTPILWSANFSLGVSALALALTTFAQNYDPSEIVIEETHHINKKDAPSGTAKFFYEVLQKLKLKIKIPNPMSHRVGESLGEHKIVFQGAGERVTFIHEATERALFAKGALDVAFWLVTQTEARFYNMLDFLKLRRLGDAP